MVFAVGIRRYLTVDFSGAEAARKPRDYSSALALYPHSDERVSWKVILAQLLK